MILEDNNFKNLHNFIKEYLVNNLSNYLILNLKKIYQYMKIVMTF